jgi:hypothetical protein
MRANEFVVEAWSAKYKRSINCDRPRGFSQRAHCQSRRKNEDVEQTAQRMDLSQALDDIPEKLREVLIMRFYHDMTFREIGAELGTHRSYAQYLVQKGLHYLRHPNRGLADRDDTKFAVPSEFFTEDLKKWFKQKWVRFNPQGKIMGPCARGSSKEGKPKCLPQKKAQALGKKGRASAAARKRRQDPNPERRGAARNVATKKK